MSDRCPLGYLFTCLFQTESSNSTVQALNQQLHLARNCHFFREGEFHFSILYTMYTVGFKNIEILTFGASHEKRHDNIE